MVSTMQSKCCSPGLGWLVGEEGLSSALHSPSSGGLCSAPCSGEAGAPQGQGVQEPQHLPKCLHPQSTNKRAICRARSLSSSTLLTIPARKAGCPFPSGGSRGGMEEPAWPPSHGRGSCTGLRCCDQSHGVRETLSRIRTASSPSR